MKRERKAFVYIVNAPSETKKIKVKKRRECLNLLLKKVWKTSPNLALQGSICLLWRWQYDLNNARRSLFSFPSSYYVKEHCGSASVTFMKTLYISFIQIGIGNKDEHTKNHTNCSISVFTLGGFASREVNRLQMRWLLWEEIDLKVTGKQEVCKSKPTTLCSWLSKECSMTICFFSPFYALLWQQNIYFKIVPP